ncbi:hypothetical protein ACROYT_G010683 [Oculina patagonica]
MFGVFGGKLYARTPPKYASDNWIGSATVLGSKGWDDFKFLFFHPDGTLHGVLLNGKFYKGPPPDGSSAADWVAKATIVGTSGFHTSCLRKICRIYWPQKITNKELYQRTGQRDIAMVIKQRRWRWLGHVIRKGRDSITRTALRWTPDSGRRKKGRPRETWRRTIEAEMKTAGKTWKELEKFLFFDPEGMLYGVYNDKFYKRLPPAYGSDNWIGTATLVGTHGWSFFKFLFFDPEGILYGVFKNGKFHKRSPPTAGNDNWLGSSTLIGATGWNRFHKLFFMADGDLYGVFDGKFFKRSSPTHERDDWLGSSKKIGSAGWHLFKFLMSALNLIMSIMFQLCILVSVFGTITCSSVGENLLFGVFGGKLYARTPPKYASDNWIGSATVLGSKGWDDFKFLFFHPDGTLYGVLLNGKFYKGPPPDGSSAADWVAKATIVGTSGWNGFQFLFFDPEGMLYGVYNDKFYKRLPPAYGSDNWIGSATLVGSRGWSLFKFLFFDPEGILYGVFKNGKFHKRSPPTAGNDNWLGSSTLIGTTGWNRFQKLFFMADGDLYGVFDGKFFKRSPPTHGRDAWLGSSKKIGSAGWHLFKFLMSPLK